MNTWALSLTLSLASVLGEELPRPAASLTTEQAARLYRIEVYNQFRTNRAEYDRRIAQGEQVWKDFEAAGFPVEHRDTITTWFIAGRESATVGDHRTLPQLPSLPVVAKQSKQAKPEQHFIATSGREERPFVDRVPSDVATKLDVKLPSQAEQTGPTRAFSSIVKQTFSVFRAPSSKVADPAAPMTIELPKDKRVIDTTTPEPSTPATNSPPKAAPPVEPTPASPTTVEVEDPFAVKALFEPATTPAVTVEPATDADPFAP